MRKRTKTKRPKTLTGVIQTTHGGLGFVSHPNFKEDIRIEQGSLNTALNGDTVEVTFQQVGKRRVGTISKILTRAKKQFVGVLEKENGMYFLVPDDRRMYTDILISKVPHDTPNNYKAVAMLTHWDDPAQNPVGTIVEILGPRGEHETEIRSIVADKGIDTTFPEDVEHAARQIQEEWHATEKRYMRESIELGERRDFRNVPTFTIDPHDAKDFDDALSLRKIKSLYEVGIHIADVSHFVRPGTALDEEARERGFSTYLVDRTIPMLPEALSNDLCSLNPDTDRLTFSLVFTLDKDANVRDRWFGKTAIHSDKRFTYEEAQEILNNKKGGVHYRELSTLNELSKKLRERRMRAGSIDFETEEVEVLLDDTNKPVRIYRKELKDTNKLIEDFMLLANREVATHIFKARGQKNVERAFIYRIHDHPDREKLEQVQMLVRALGYDLGKPGERIDAGVINKLFRDIADTPVENILKTALIRTMARAEYGTKNIGHFGLGFDYYTHFTSPIRRYPDLVVHRLLLEHLQDRHISNREYELYKQLAWELSKKEAAIQEAERESIKYKQVEYMSTRIGETFEGVISGITEWGVYVEEKKTGAEGLVRVSALTDDYYMLDAKHYRLVGKRRKKKYTLGDSVRMKVAATNVDQRTIDFELV